jgi:dodecin
MFGVGREGAAPRSRRSRPAGRPASSIPTLTNLHSLEDNHRSSNEEELMSGVIIIREMVGTSPRSWSDAARQAVATASRTVRNIRTIEVVKSTAAVEDGEIVEYRVELKIGFEYEG